MFMSSSLHKLAKHLTSKQFNPVQYHFTDAEHNLVAHPKGDSLRTMLII